jgi:prolyl-tRNA editing enzyme YbaK/EbsC (Cys-tRNA(Pro) deacylase)
MSDTAANGHEDLLERPAVRRVKDALQAGGSPARIIALSDTARTAEDAARAVGCELGAIVKSLVFTIGDQPVMVLVAGDRRCNDKALKTAFGLSGKVRRADAETVRAATGFTIGGVAPIAHATPLPVIIDDSLQRFETIYAAAGHPHCVFATSVNELASLARATVQNAVSH